METKIGSLGLPQRMKPEQIAVLALFDDDLARQARFDAKQAEKGLHRKRGPELVSVVRSDSPLQNDDPADVPPTYCAED